MAGELLVGTCEVEITPPIGTPLCGSLIPRGSEGVDDPLYAKALVLESGGVRMAYVILDVALMLRREGDEAVRLAARRTGIRPDHIVWTCSHTHSGPYTCFEEEMDAPVVNRQWLAELPERIAEAVAGAEAAKAPARAFRARSYCNGLAHNRRNRYKGGRQVNTWLQHQAEDVQCVGAAGPVDPEVFALALEGMDGRMLAVLFHYTLHANMHWGPHMSGDYPAVVAARMRERFGPQVATFYVPGAAGDVNAAGVGYRQAGNALSDVILAALARRKPLAQPLRLGARKRDVVAPYHDIYADQEGRIQVSGWDETGREFFRRGQRILQRDGRTQATTVLQAWHIGEVGFVSLPGEPFVEVGMRIKQEGPFPWTFPVELGGDYQGYLISQRAWDEGGYESLIACTSLITPAGVQMLVDRGLEMLRELHAAAV